MIFSENKFFSCFYPNDSATHRLFCLPSAGGDANMFRDWFEYFPDTEVWGVTYPGRGVLSQSEFSESFGQLTRALVSELDSYKDKPFLFFGHSFGALLSYAIALELAKDVNPLEGLLVCARRAPQAKDRHGFSQKSDKEVLEKLMAMNSIPLAIAESDDLLEYYLNIIIKDLTLNETLIPVTSESLNLPLYVYSGRADEFVSIQEMGGWPEITTGKTISRQFEGDHFFIVNNKDEFLDQFSQDVEFLQGIDEDSVAY